MSTHRHLGDLLVRVEGSLSPDRVSIMQTSDNGGVPDGSVLEDYRTVADDAVVDAIIDQFLGESAAAVAAIGAATLQRDAVRLRAAAHGLRGSSATIGARALEALCGEIEALSGAGAIDDAARLAPALRGEYERVRGELCSLSHREGGALH